MFSRCLFFFVHLCWVPISCSNETKDEIPYNDKEELHVIFIGLDGWGGHNIEKTFSHMPNVCQYAKSGIYTDNKLAVIPTLSMPNWASIFMGANPSIHGYIENSKRTITSYPFDVKNNIFPTISQAIRSCLPDSEIGLFCQWDGILYLADTLSINHVANIPFLEESSHFIFSDSVSTYIKSKNPLFCTIVFDDPDWIGHASNYFSDKYYLRLEVLDKCIAKIVNTVIEAGFYNNTVFILTSDHGGKGNEHGGDSEQEKKTPFIMWGKGINSIGYVNDNLEQQDISVIIADIFNISKPLQWTGKSHMSYFK